MPFRLVQPVHAHFGSAAECRVSAYNSPGKNSCRGTNTLVTVPCIVLDMEVVHQNHVHISPALRAMCRSREESGSCLWLVDTLLQLLPHCESLQKATACSMPEEITAEMSQCPVTCFLAHELSPKEVALLQGKPCSACGFIPFTLGIFAQC